MSFFSSAAAEVTLDDLENVEGFDTVTSTNVLTLSRDNQLETYKPTISTVTAIDPDGGLKQFSNGIGIHAGTALSTSADGLALEVDPLGGLETDIDGTFIKLASQPGLEITSAGLEVRANNGCEVAADEVRVVIDGGGLDTSSGRIDLRIKPYDGVHVTYPDGIALNAPASAAQNRVSRGLTALEAWKTTVYTNVQGVGIRTEEGDLITVFSDIRFSASPLKYFRFQIPIQKNGTGQVACQVKGNGTYVQAAYLDIENSFNALLVGSFVIDSNETSFSLRIGPRTGSLIGLAGGRCSASSLDEVPN